VVRSAPDRRPGLSARRARRRAAAEVDALVARSPFARLARARLVFVNGAFDEARSQLPASGDVEFVRLAADSAPRWLTESVAADGKDPISALNAAFVSDGGALRIAAGATADAPIEMVFVSTSAEPSTLTTRNVVVLEEGASATIIETHLGGGEAYVANSVTEARLGKGSRLDRVKLEAEGQAPSISPTSTPTSARTPHCATSR
jgi:Fe-S cluster assembly protein SufD